MSEEYAQKVLEKDTTKPAFAQASEFQKIINEQLKSRLSTQGGFIISLSLICSFIINVFLYIKMSHDNQAQYISDFDFTYITDDTLLASCIAGHLFLLTLAGILFDFFLVYVRSVKELVRMSCLVKINEKKFLASRDGFIINLKDEIERNESLIKTKSEEIKELNRKIENDKFYKNQRYAEKIEEIEVLLKMHCNIDLYLFERKNLTGVEFAKLINNIGESSQVIEQIRDIFETS